MIVAFRASPRRWTLLLPSGAPIWGQAAPSSGGSWRLKGPLPRTGSCRGADLNVVILLDDSFPLAAPVVDVATSIRTSCVEVESEVHQFQALSGGVVRCPAAPARHALRLQPTARPQRRSAVVSVQLKFGHASRCVDAVRLGEVRGLSSTSTPGRLRAENGARDEESVSAVSSQRRR